MLVKRLDEYNTVILTEPLSLIITILAVIAGSTLQSISGLGLAVIASPILVLINPNFLPAPILFLGCMLSLLSCIRYRHQLYFKNITMALLGRIPGSLLGVYLLMLLPVAYFSIGFSLFILLSVLLTYRHISFCHCSRNLFFAGFFSGLMATTTSVGGPPIALVYQNTKASKLRSELGLFFLLGTLMSLGFLWGSGNISHDQIQLTLPLIPPVFVGFALSIWLDKYIKQLYLKPLIALMSLCSCGILLIKTLFT